MSTYGSTETGLYDSLMDELSYDQIQQMLDQIMGENSFSFSEMVRSLMHSGKADTLDNISTMMRELAASAFSQDRKLFVSILAIALVYLDISVLEALIIEILLGKNLGTVEHIRSYLSALYHTQLLLHIFTLALLYVDEPQDKYGDKVSHLR